MYTRFIRLPRKFYERDTLAVGRELLGKILIRTLNSKQIAGKIVELECYKSHIDSGSYVKTKPHLAKPMFGRGGYSFITMVHGHTLLNIITEKEGKAGAILIRAIEPIFFRNAKLRTNGPAKLARAMAITKNLDGVDLTSSNELYVCFPKSSEKFETVASRRINVKDNKHLWRFYIKGNKYVSKK